MEKNWGKLALSYRDKGCNCAQAVALAFASYVDLDEGTLYRITEGFGGGMGGYDGTCGAISGAVTILSLLHSSGVVGQITKEQTYQIVKEHFDRFVAQAGSSVCKELLGHESGEPLHSCSDCIEDSANILATLLDNKIVSAR